MAKLFESVNDKSQSILQKLHAELLPAVFLWKVPKREKFAWIKLRFPGDEYWPSVVGKVCEIQVRYKIKFKARLLSCVYKKLKGLTKEDAIACGYNDRTALITLKASLARRMNLKKSWKGEDTELEILSFENI